LGDPLQAFNTKKFLGLGGKTLILTSKGLIGDDRAATGGVAWGQVKEIYQNLRDQYVNGMHTARIRKYSLVLANGRKLVIDQRYSGIDELGRQLQMQVTASLQSKAANALECGERLVFGSLAIAQSGLSLKGKELPWSEVENVSVNAGYLVVSKRAGSRADYAVHRSLETAAGVLTRIAGTAQPMLGAGRGIQWKKVSAHLVPNIYLLTTLSQEMIKKTSARDGESHSSLVAQSST
jgi:hypothetical protein